MTYLETVQYLFTQFPSFKKYGAKAVKYGLHNIENLCALANHPQQKFKSIHIAGTNGKGSVTHILAAIFMQAGYKTGTLTSPHYKDFRERIKINGQYIPKEDVVLFVETYRMKIEELQASFFEITTAMSFWYFDQQQVDIAIIETGLGGRLDSTNVIQPDLSIITNIGLDHQQMLGDTIEKIAYEKAGIIKKNTPVVIGKTQSETKHVFEEVAAQNNAPLYFSKDILEVSIAKNVDINLNQHLLKYSHPAKTLIIETDLKGSYQQQNLQTALTAVEVYQKKYGTFIQEDKLRYALKSIKRISNLLGKWMVLQQAPLVVADSAHNEDGITSVLDSIKTISFKKLHIVFGMMKDKAVEPILKLLPNEATYYFCSPDFKRALAVETLLKEAERHGLKGKAYSSVEMAHQSVILDAGKDDLVLIIGSCFLVAQVL